MGFMDTFKRFVGVESNPTANPQAPTQVTDHRPILTQDIAINSTKSIPNTNSLSLSYEMVQHDIFELLWFIDGPYKNYTPEARYIDKINFHGYTMEISFMGSKEPSALSVTAPVQRPDEMEDTPRPQYYPAYMEITPQQRWIYLNWLKNIDEDINIGYVFIFYYGLERHLYFGQYEKAFRTILRLRKIHKNNSFLGYSANALIACCLLHKREDLFFEYLNSLGHTTAPLEVSSLHLTAKKLLNIGLTPKEIIALSRYVGFSNKKYIKEEPVLFEVELKKLLNEHFGEDVIRLAGYPMEECGLTFEYIAANFSLDQKQRCLNVPNLAYHPELKKILCGILQQTHENVKGTLKEMKKVGTLAPALVTPVYKQSREPDEAFKESPLFPAIDVHIFDVNVEHQQNGTCPSCGNMLLKKPVSKGKCISCGSVIFVKNSVFTGSKVYLTEDQYQQMVAIRDERVRRNAIRNSISQFGFTQEEVWGLMQSHQLSLECAIFDLAKERGLKCRAKSELGLYRNVLLGIGELYDKLHKPEEALLHFLVVCYYDLCGGENSEKRWNKKFAFLAPAVSSWIIRLGDDLHYKRVNMRRAFLEACAMYHEDDMPLSPEKAWPKLAKTLYKEKD